MGSEIGLLRSQKELLQTRLDLLKARRRSDGIVRIAEATINQGGRLGVWAFIYLTAVEFAGQVTWADISLHVPGGNIDDYVQYGAAIAALVYGFNRHRLAAKERRLRYEKTEYLQGRIKALELQLDPDRSSSDLSPTGETNPEDI